tara:strand:+ start:37 stop:639 length:603 start_codon:yes stop_codon:yes gene_type:complete
MDNLLDNINLNIKNISDVELPNKIINNFNFKNKLKSYVLKNIKKNPNEFSKNLLSKNDKILELYKNINKDEFLNINIKNTKENITYIKNKINIIKNNQSGGYKLDKNENIDKLIDNSFNIIENYHVKNKLKINKKNKFDLNDVLFKTKQYKQIINNPIFYINDYSIINNNDEKLKYKKECYLNFKKKYINFLINSIKKIN